MLQTGLSSTARWTIHRPRHGWYIALRPASSTSPAHSSISPTGFLSLDSVPSSSSNGTALGFSLRLPLTDGGSSAADATASRAPADSPDVQIDINPIESVPLAQSTSALGSETESARFVLRPLPPPPRPAGIWGALKAGGSSVRAAVLSERALGWACYALLREGEEEVMRWEDTTGVLATATSGVLRLAERLPLVRGIDEAFWAAVALAYVEFTQDQAAYLAATSD